MANGNGDARRGAVWLGVVVAVVASFVTGRITQGDATASAVEVNRQRMTAIEARMDRKDTADAEFRRDLKLDLSEIRSMLREALKRKESE